MSENLFIPKRCEREKKNHVSSFTHFDIGGDPGQSRVVAYKEQFYRDGWRTGGGVATPLSERRTGSSVRGGQDPERDHIRDPPSAGTGRAVSFLSVTSSGPGPPPHPMGGTAISTSQIQGCRPVFWPIARPVCGLPPPPLCPPHPTPDGSTLRLLFNFTLWRNLCCQKDCVCVCVCSLGVCVCC